MVDCFKAFASHMNVPKGNGDVYHEPYKDTCIESDIVIDDCNKHAQTSKSPISYKHVNLANRRSPYRNQRLPLPQKKNGLKIACVDRRLGGGEWRCS
jgi:hypothetical protein